MLQRLYSTSDWSAITGLSRHHHNHISASALLVFLQLRRCLGSVDWSRLYRLPAGSFKKLRFLNRACETMCFQKDKMGTLSHLRIHFFKHYNIMLQPKLFKVTLRSTDHSTTAARCPLTEAFYLLFPNDSSFLSSLSLPHAAWVCRWAGDDLYRCHYCYETISLRLSICTVLVKPIKRTGEKKGL